ncbi:MAG TPA: proton-conducting transporter membrane subunit [Candidatus Cloacimonadota bacterium]|nr:proton-conducting transporter membrane subunit [Candidatus Cloacimonadota bacterium]HPT72625.1 proton-conducting transporter membrane subunit [Candidatus Cloacimonadota bacterium]
MTLLLILILMPFITGIIVYFIKNNPARRLIWLLVAIAHVILTIKAAYFTQYLLAEQWIGMDSLSALFLSLTSFLFFLVTIYGIGYVSREPAEQRPDSETGGLLHNAPESVFTGSMLIFLASMTLAILSRHLGLQWVAIETTTLASAPLIYYHQNRRSLEAAWKYLILCSVGIAIALMGIFFIGLSLPQGVHDITLLDLLQNAGKLNHKWLELAFVLMLVGYGTKMGLAPMHNWLPDAHSEAPSPVSALLSGALLNCAFLGILRIQQVFYAAGIASFGQDLLLLFGLISIGTAAIFLLGQTDYKRMLAYSSVEHMGILTLGMGIGGLGVFGSLLQMINHSIVKVILFLTAGNIHSKFHTKNASDVKGLSKVMPVTAGLWFVGFLAIVGSPPFGIFVSEFTILRAAILKHLWVAAILFSLFLVIAFIGITNVILPMIFGPAKMRRRRETFVTLISAIILAVLALNMGLWIPGWLDEVIRRAAVLLEGGMN